LSVSKKHDFISRFKSAGNFLLAFAATVQIVKAGRSSIEVVAAIRSRPKSPALGVATLRIAVNVNFPDKLRETKKKEIEGSLL